MSHLRLEGKVMRILVIALSVLLVAGALGQDGDKAPKKRAMKDRVWAEGKVVCIGCSLAAEYGVKFRPGVLVQAIVPGSPLEAFVEPGFIIVAVMDGAVRDLDEFFDRLGDGDLRRSRGVWITAISPDGKRVDYRLQLP